MKQTIPSIQDCQDFINGRGPTNTLDRALLAKMNAAQLRARCRDEMRSLEAYQKSMQKLEADRKRIEATAANRSATSSKPSTAKPAPKPIAPAKAKPSAPAPRPHAKDETDHLVLCVRRGYGIASELAAMKQELAVRGVTIHKIGWSVSQKKSQ